MTNSNSSFTASVRGLIDDVSMLIRQEFELAKAEAGEKVEQLQTGIISIVAGLLVATCAVLVLVQAVVVALSNVMPPSLAAASVGVVLAGIAFIAIKHGENNLRPSNLAPRRTIRSVSEGADRVKETF